MNPEGESTAPVLSILHVRPLLASEQAAACCNVVSVGENETVNVQGRQYAFDCVVGEGGHSRQHMCLQYIQPLVKNVCKGVNCAVLAYGQTSSGKTYTMGIGKEQLQALSSGDDGAVNDLVIPYALRQLFANVEEERGERIFTLLVSFVEVYMEKYYDLLARRQPVVAKTRYDGEVMLVGAQLRQVESMEDVIRILQIGGMARITKGTNQNDRSSRSHAVLTIHVQSRAAPAAELSAPASPFATSTARAASTTCGLSCSADESGSTPLPAPPVLACAAVDSGNGAGAALSAALAAPPLAAKLHLVDLAGSESVGRAGAVGLAAKEGNNINLSLMTLRTLIQLLAAPKAAPKVVLPYRDSKLTTLLRDALGGNSSTLFVACVSPADVNAAMTVSTLEFATTARRIRTKPAVNIGGAGSAEVLELHRIILKLRSELEQLRRQAVPGTLSPQRSPRRISQAMRTSMTFSAAVAAASVQPSMPSPSQLLMAGSCTPSLSHMQQQHQQISQHLMSRRSSVATGLAGTPIPLTFRLSANGMSSAASAQVPHGPPVIAARTTSPGAAHACGGAQDSRYSAAQPLPTGAGDRGAPDGVEGCVEGAARGPRADASDTGEAMVTRLPPKMLSAGGGKDYGLGAGHSCLAPCAVAGPLGKAARTMHRRRRRKPSARRSGVDREQQQHNGAGTSGSGSPSGGSVQLHRARYTGSVGSADSGTEDGGGDSDGASSNCLSSGSSSGYDGSGGSHDEWQSVAQLQQRLVLLEAENEHLQKHVGHLSAVISELRAQLDDAHAARAASPSNLSITPSVRRGVRNSASGSLLGQSMMTATTARLQRLGASVGGVSRISRSPFSPSQQCDSPFASVQKPSPLWGDSRMRMSCGEGTPAFGFLGLRRTAVGAVQEDSLALRSLDAGGAAARGSRPGLVGGSEAGSPCSAPRRYISDTGVTAASTSPCMALLQAHRGDEPCGAAAARAFAVGSPVPLSAAAWQASDPGGGPPLAEANSAGCGMLPQVAEEPHEESEGGAERFGGDDSTLCRAGEMVDGPDGVVVVGEAPPMAGCVQGVQQLGSARGSSAQSPAAISPAQSDRAPVAIDCEESRMLCMLNWIGQRVADTESLLTSQQTGLRRLLAEQGLTLGPAEDGLPALDTLQCFAATQLAGVEAELSGLGACSRKGSLSVENSPRKVATDRPQDQAGGPYAAAAAGEGAATVTARRIELLRGRRASLQDLCASLKRAAELEASLELQREIQMLVAVYAGLSSNDDVGVATGPAVARAAAAAEQQLLSLRRSRRQQIIKEAIVAREKLRELEMLPGPPTPLEFGVLVVAAGGGSSGGGSATPGASGPPSLTLSASQRSGGAMSWLAWGSAAGPTHPSSDAAEDEWDFEVERASGAATPQAGATGIAAQAGVGGVSGAGCAAASPVPPPLPPLPPLPAAPQPSPSLLSQLLPALSPMASWRRGGNKDAVQPPPQQQPAQPPQQQQQQQHPLPHLQLSSRSNSASGPGGSQHGKHEQRRMLVQPSQVRPWVDTLLDYETRVHQYNRVLAGTLQEREAVYAQLQEAEHDLEILAEMAAVQVMVQGGPTAAAAPPRGMSPGSQGGNLLNGRTEGGASFSGWMSSPMRAVLRGSDAAVQQHAALLSVRQAKLQSRLEELCMEVASLQQAIVEAQESRSAATERDDWWACVPTLGLARPALRMLLERAAEYRAAYVDAVARADRLEQQVEELGLQHQEMESRLGAQSLELTATRAAALAAVAGPGLNQSFSDAVAVLLQQHQHRGTRSVRGDGGSVLASPSTVRESSTTCLSAEILGGLTDFGAARSTAGSPSALSPDFSVGTPRG